MNKNLKATENKKIRIIGKNIQNKKNSPPKKKIIISKNIPKKMIMDLKKAPRILKKTLETAVSRNLVGLNPLPYPQEILFQGEKKLFIRIGIEKK